MAVRFPNSPLHYSFCPLKCQDGKRRAGETRGPFRRFDTAFIIVCPDAADQDALHKPAEQNGQKDSREVVHNFQLGNPQDIQSQAHNEHGTHHSHFWNHGWVLLEKRRQEAGKTGNPALNYKALRKQGPPDFR